MSTKILLITFALFNIGRAGTLPQTDQKTEFEFLGSYNLSTKTGGINKFNYFTSVNPTTFAVAEKDCVTVFGNKASLLNLETNEEEDAVITLLSESDSTATVFWTSGQYDSRNSVWRWGNGVEVGSWSYWGPGQPPASPNSQSRITFYFESKFNSWWETQYTTVPARYICELGISA